MRLIPCRKIVDGAQLARDVVSGPPGTTPLLRAGVRLSARYAALLPQSGVGSVWITDDLGESIEIVEPLSPETRAKLYRATGSAIKAAGSAVLTGSDMPVSVVDALGDVAAKMVADLLDCPDAALSLDDLHTYDSYTHRHSVQVSVVGMLIAGRAWALDGWTDYRGERRRDRIEDRLRKLGLGLLLHDIGKLAVPPEILHKPGPLDDAEMAVMRTHPMAGVDLLRSADLSPLTLSAIRDHHERLDGSGYPAGRAGAEVQDFARIAAVADVYDAVTSERVYSTAAPPHLGVQMIRDGAGTAFCADVVRHFGAIVMPYPLGHEIRLPDGRTGVVSSVDRAEPDRPTVRVRSGGGAIEEFVVDMAAARSAAV
jgi:HD-GYP domain-containing protein (c-di-GMP phosphodiesterase class II)